MPEASGGRGRANSDEFYVLDLCDEVLGEARLRQHRFPWLLGDPSAKTGRTVALPVDGYWPGHNIVVEFYGRQHPQGGSVLRQAGPHDRLRGVTRRAAD